MTAPGQPRGAVTVRDLGIGELRAKLLRLKTEQITVGHQGPSGAAPHPGTNGVPVATVAQWHEYGTPGSDDKTYDVPRSHIPSRPMLRITYERNRDRFREALRVTLAAMIDRRGDLEDGQDKIGGVMLDALRETILDAKGWAEPLAASTIKRKGHDDPLIESGTLYDRASWAVRDGGAIVRQGGEQ